MSGQIFNPADHHPARIRKVRDKLDFEDIKFPVKIKDNYKMEKKNYIGISVFGYENKVKYKVNVSTKC